MKSAERKRPRDGNIDKGIVIAELESREQRTTVLRAKCNLKNSRNYRTVYIEPDTDLQTREAAANWRLILNEIGKQDDYVVLGSRIVCRHQGRRNDGSTAQDPPPETATTQAGEIPVPVQTATMMIGTGHPVPAETTGTLIEATGTTADRTSTGRAAAQTRKLVTITTVISGQRTRAASERDTEGRTLASPLRT